MKIKLFFGLFPYKINENLLSSFSKFHYFIDCVGAPANEQEKYEDLEILFCRKS